MNLCKDCRHYEASELSTGKQNYDKCTYTDPQFVDLVRGEPRGGQSADYCTVLRASASPQNCGAQGRFFEAAVDRRPSNEGYAAPGTLTRSSHTAVKEGVDKWT